MWKWCHLSMSLSNFVWASSLWRSRPWRRNFFFIGKVLTSRRYLRFSSWNIIWGSHLVRLLCWSTFLVQESEGKATVVLIHLSASCDSFLQIHTNISQGIGSQCEVPFRCFSGVRASSRRTGEIPPVKGLVRVNSGSCTSWIDECGEAWRYLLKGPTIWICRQSLYISLYITFVLLCLCYFNKLLHFARRLNVFVDFVHQLRIR